MAGVEAERVGESEPEAAAGFELVTAGVARCERLGAGAVVLVADRTGKVAAEDAGSGAGGKAAPKFVR